MPLLLPLPLRRTQRSMRPEPWDGRGGLQRDCSPRTRPTHGGDHSGMSRTSLVVGVSWRIMGHTDSWTPAPHGLICWVWDRAQESVFVQHSGWVPKADRFGGC